MLVVPDESGWIVKRRATDLTSRLLRESEGHASRARRIKIDCPSRRGQPRFTPTSSHGEKKAYVQKQRRHRIDQDCL